MFEEHGQSRRAVLKRLGAMGAAVAVGARVIPLRAQGATGQDKRVNAAEVAVERMGRGHSCAQSVCSALAEQMGLDYQAAVKLSAGFGGGMGDSAACAAP